LAITYDYIDDYLYRIAQPRDLLLQKMEEEAESGAVPIIGPLVGRLLYNLARSSQSKNVLEIGTAIGYSGIWLGRAVSPLNGSVTTIDKDPERVRRAEQNIAEAKLQKVIKVLKGDALQILPTLKDEYDLVFLDSDKNIYLDAFKLSVKKLRKRATSDDDQVQQGSIRIPRTVNSNRSTPRWSPGRSERVDVSKTIALYSAYMPGRFFRLHYKFIRFCTNLFN